ncbi:MAG TPA: hypothetical protein VN257_00795 [Actinotalea sp.]|nr:hypothetical protein [Actinotalea sp.]
MRRLFWVGVGAVGTLVVARRVRAAWNRYTPEGVAEQVEQAGQGAVEAVHAAVDRFRTARAARELELTTTLLATPDGGDASAVFHRRAPARPAGWDDAAPAAPSRPRGRVDEDEPLYDF